MISKQFRQLSLKPNAESGQAAYLELGQGAPLLLLHGFLGSSSHWVPLMERLQSQFHCVGLDLLGFGDSAKPALRYDIATELTFVRQFVESQALEPCYILGYSFGGWVAAAYALAYPQAVKGLVLVAPAGIRDDSFCGRYDHLRPLLWQTPVVDWGLNLAQPLVTQFGNASEFEQFRLIRRELMANPAARSFLVDRLRPEDAIDTVEREIQRLQVPTLVVTGDRDETIPLWHSETYANEISGAKLVVIPNADHALPQTHSLELAELVSEFLSKAQNPV